MMPPRDTIFSFQVWQVLPGPKLDSLRTDHYRGDEEKRQNARE